LISPPTIISSLIPILFHTKIRFIRLPRVTLAGSSVAPGPASATYYEVPPILQDRPGLNLPAKFRSELSLAFSKAYHFKPHALILSYLEGKCLSEYDDHDAYALSEAFYQYPRSPVIDALNTRADVVASRRLFNRNQLPQPNDNNSW